MGLYYHILIFYLGITLGPPHRQGSATMESNLTYGTFKGYFTPLVQLNKFPDLPDSTREEA